jgi:hypothetical protein
MVDIPNTGTNGLVLSSVGNGTNASQWVASTGGGSTTLAGDVTGPSGSNTVAKIKGTALGTLTGATNGQVLTWDTSTSTWIPTTKNTVPNGVAAGQLLVWSGSAWTYTLGGYASNGSMLYNDATYGWSSASGPGNNQTYVWTTASGGSWLLKTYGVANYIGSTSYPVSSGATPTTAGQLFVWNGTAWSIALSSGYSSTGQMLYNDATYGWSGASGPTTNTFYVWNGSSWTLQTPGIAKYINTTAYPVSSGATPSTAGQLMVWNGTAWSIALSSGYSSTGQMLYNDATYGWSGASGPGNNQYYVWSTAGSGSWTLKTSGVATYLNTASYPVTATPTAVGQLLNWTGSAWAATTSGGSSNGSMLYWSSIYGWSTTSGPTANGQYYAWNTAAGGSWDLTTPASSGANQAWAITNQNAGLALTAGTTYTPSAWTITASGFSNYLVQISCTVKMTTATAGTCSIGIQVGGSLFGGTSGITYGALNAQSVTVNGSYLLSSVSGSQVIQGQVAPGGSSGVFYNGNMTVIGIS